MAGPGHCAWAVFGLFLFCFWGMQQQAEAMFLLDGIQKSIETNRVATRTIYA